MSWNGFLVKTVLAAGVIIGMSGCGGREKVAIASKDETIRRQEELLAKERSEKDSLYDANKALADQNEALANQHAKAMQQNASEIAQMRQQMASLEEAMSGLGKSFAAAKPGQVGVDDGQSGIFTKDANGNIKIIVASSVLFDSGRADLKSTSHGTLTNIGKVIREKFPNNFLRIEGHTDSTPVVRNKDKFRDNMELSIARSRAVYDFMRSSGGIAANKMYTAGYGEFSPIVHPEKTASDRAKNRRVEIVILPLNVKIEKEKLADARK
jgi:chemotaxis protein MotB